MKSLAGATLLITGGSGFTGQHACAHFTRQGMKVVALTRTPDKWRGGKLDGMAVLCDVMDEQQVRSTIKEIQPDYVLHLAGQNAVHTSWNEPIQTVMVNMIGTLHLLDALREQESHKTRIIVVTSKLKSSLFDTFAPAHPYAFSKGLQELASLAWSSMFKLDVMLAEPSNLIGPGPSTGICTRLARHAVLQELEGRASQAQRASQQQPPPFQLHSGSSPRDYVDVRDAVRAYAYLLQHGEQGRSYEITSGVDRTLNDVVEGLEMCTSSELHVTWQAASYAEELLDRDDKLHNAEEQHKGNVDLHRAVELRDSEVDQYYAGEPSNGGTSVPQVSIPSSLPSAARRSVPMTELGWKPSLSFEQSLQDIIDYCREQMR